MSLISVAIVDLALDKPIHVEFFRSSDFGERKCVEEERTCV